MNTDKPLSAMTIDEVVVEAIRREKMMMDFYERAMDGAGPDARLLMANLYTQHCERIIQLERLREKINELRELSAPIAD